jgi:hypothetical protein
MAREKFEYVQSPHIEARKKLNPELAKSAKGFNNKLGLAITKGVGTMWAAYVFMALTLVSLPAVIAKGDPVLIVSWIAQTFLQLVLLPIIIVGQNIQATAAEERAKATYKDAEAVLHEAQQIQAHLSHQDKALEHLFDRIDQLEKKLEKN